MLRMLRQPFIRIRRSSHTRSVAQWYRIQPSPPRRLSLATQHGTTRCLEPTARSIPILSALRSRRCSTEKLSTIAREREPYEAGDLGWLDLTARNVIAAVAETNQDSDGVAAHFFDDLQTLERIAERYALESTLHSYAQLNLFTERFDLAWLVVADGA